MSSIHNTYDNQEMENTNQCPRQRDDREEAPCQNRYQEHNYSGTIKIESQANSHKYRILEKLEFVKYIQKKVTGIQIHFLETEIQFSGTDLDNFKEEISYFIQYNLCQGRVPYPTCLLEFVSEKLITDKIEQYLRQSNINCYWFVDDKIKSIEIYATESTILEKAKKFFKKSIVCERFGNNANITSFWEQDNVQVLLENKKDFIRVSDIDQEEFIVFGFEEEMRELSQHFDKFSREEKFKAYMLQHETCKTNLGVKEEVLKFLEKRKLSEWKDFLTNYNVNIEVGPNGDVLVVGATMAVEDAVSHFQTKYKFERLRWSCDVLYPKTIIQMMFKSKKISDIEQKYDCSVDVNTDSSFAEQHQICQWVDEKKNMHVVLVYGNANGSPADVLVVPTDECYQLTNYGKTFMEKVGIVMKDDFSQMKQSNKKEIFLSSQCGDLPCKTVAYLPITRDKSGKVLLSDLSKCFRTLFGLAETEQLQSLVMPLKIVDDIPETTLLQIFTGVFKQFYSQFNFLSQIYLCTCSWESLEHECLIDMSDRILPNTMNKYGLGNLLHLQVPVADTVEPHQQVDIGINLVKGNLVDQKVDVIVNSCNQVLDLKKGKVSASIDYYGGPAIQADCIRKYPKGICHGQIAQTCAGNLNFRFILHTSLPHWTSRANFSIQLLASLVYDCLDIVGKQGCKSIAFPVFGTGTLQYPWDEVARVMLDTIRKFGAIKSGQSSIKEVTIVLYENDEKSILAFERRMKVCLRKEDSDHPSKQILLARLGNVQLQCLPFKDPRYSHCEAIVYFATLEEIENLRKNPKSKFIVKEIMISRNDIEGLLEITVHSLKAEKSYKEAMTKALEFTANERISSVAICMRQELGIECKDQALFILDIVCANKKNKYLQIVKVIHPDKELFNEMIEELNQIQDKEKMQRSKIKGRHKHKWKCTRYFDVVQIPRILITAVSENFKYYEKLKADLEKAVEVTTKSIRSETPMSTRLSTQQTHQLTNQGHETRSQEATNQSFVFCQNKVEFPTESQTHADYSMSSYKVHDLSEEQSRSYALDEESQGSSQDRPWTNMFYDKIPGYSQELPRSSMLYNKFSESLQEQPGSNMYYDGSPESLKEQSRSSMINDECPESLQKQPKFSIINDESPESLQEQPRSKMLYDESPVSLQEQPGSNIINDEGPDSLQEQPGTNINNGESPEFLQEQPRTYINNDESPESLQEHPRSSMINDNSPVSMVYLQEQPRSSMLYNESLNDEEEYSASSKTIARSHIYDSAATQDPSTSNMFYEESLNKDGKKHAFSYATQQKHDYLFTGSQTIMSRAQSANQQPNNCRQHTTGSDATPKAGETDKIFNNAQKVQPRSSMFYYESLHDGEECPNPAATQQIEEHDYLLTGSEMHMSKEAKNHIQQFQNDRQQTIEMDAKLKTIESTRVYNNAQRVQPRSNMFYDESLIEQGKNRDMLPSIESERVKGDGEDDKKHDANEEHFYIPLDKSNSASKQSLNKIPENEIKLKLVHDSLFSVLKKKMTKKYSDVRLEVVTGTVPT